MENDCSHVIDVLGANIGLSQYICVCRGDKTTKHRVREQKWSQNVSEIAVWRFVPVSRMTSRSVVSYSWRAEEVPSVVTTPSNTLGSTFFTWSTTFAIWNARINSTTTRSVQTLEFLTSKMAESCFWMSASFTRNPDQFSREEPVLMVPRQLKGMRISWPKTLTTQRDSDISSSGSFLRCLADGVLSQNVSSPNFLFALF